MLKKNAETSVEINETIASRWSCRAFDVNKSVSENKIISICESARWAPSCAGDEPWRFIIFNKFKDEDKWHKALECLTENNKIWVVNAPIIIFSIADTKFRKNRKENQWAFHDVGAANMNIYLQAVTLGLMAHPMAGFLAEKIIDEFNLPDNFIPITVIAVGYQAEIEVLDEFNQKREVIERKRLPLNDNFFDAEWGKSII